MLPDYSVKKYHIDFNNSNVIIEMLTSQESADKTITSTE